MKTLLLAPALLILSLISLAPTAHAQIIIQAPPVPGFRPGPPGPPPGYDGDYWRHQHEGDWGRRAEFREEEHRREEWRRAHCVRDWRGEEFCRR